MAHCAMRMALNMGPVSSFHNIQPWMWMGGVCVCVCVCVFKGKGIENFIPYLQLKPWLQHCLPPNSFQIWLLKKAETPPSKNHTANKLWARGIRTNKEGGENLRVLSPKHMSPPDTGAERFQTETLPGNFNSCTSHYAPWKSLLLQGLAWYRLLGKLGVLKGGGTPA